jgi:PAS domain S-box-containing protein
MHLKWTDEASLRRLAEEGLISNMDRVSDARGDALLHELLVHKAELEMQNEALRDAQLEIAALHARYTALFEDAPVAYIALDEQSRITAANARAAKLLGESRRALLGVKLTRHLVPEEAIPFERYRREMSESHAGLGAEFTMVVAGGAHRLVRVDGVPASGDGTGCYLTLTDVTAYNGMVRQLDSDDRSSNGAERPSRPIVDLNAVLAELEPVLPSLLGGDIGAEVDLGASDGSVRLDRAHIERILLTAVRNSRQAMPHGGGFRVETASVELMEADRPSGVAHGRFVRWAMSDTGAGMDESARSRAFEPVIPASPAEDTALGLSMVKAAVERCGGFVELESELGRGTKLVIHLPCATGSPRK